MTVGELKAALEGVPEDFVVIIDVPGDPTFGNSFLWVDSTDTFSQCKTFYINASDD